MNMFYTEMQSPTVSKSGSKGKLESHHVLRPCAGLVAGGYLLRKHWDDINKEFEEFEKVPRCVGVCDLATSPVPIASVPQQPDPAANHDSSHC